MQPLNDEFPWRRNFMPEFNEMLKRLLLLSGNIPKEWLIPQEGRLALVERSFPDDYENTDSLSDWECEYSRVKCNEKGYLSPIEVWNNLCKNDNLPTDIRERREMVYVSARGCNLFNMALAVVLLKGLENPNILWGNHTIGDVLDPCAGWGDRLGAAFITGAKSYRGWDTNPELQSVYDVLAQRYKDAGLKLNWYIECSPFEKCSEKELSELGGFDTIFTSPPYYDKEIYRGPLTSTTVYKSINEWYEKFYRVMWKKAVLTLRVGGCVIAYISEGRMFNEANKVLKECGLVYVGKVGFRQTSLESSKQSMIRDAYVWHR